MIRWMLQEMVRFPAAVFSERELRERFPDDFDWCVESSVIRRARTSRDYVGTDGDRRTTYTVGDQMIAVADRDPDVAFEVVSPLDYVRWRLDLGIVAQRISAANLLNGVFEQLDDRLMFCGESARNAYVLVLAGGDVISELLVHRRPPTLYRYDRIIAICPDVDLGATTKRSLDVEGVALVTMPPANSLVPEAWKIVPPTEIRQDAAEMRGSLDFVHDPAYVSVRWGSMEFTLNPAQAAVVRCLDEARLRRVPDVPTPTLLSLAIAHQANADKVSQIFKRTPHWRDLIVSRQRGTYRLAVPSP